MAMLCSFYNMQKSAIIVAGGTGTRMGGSVPKQFLPLNGVPLLIYTLRSFLQFDAQMPIVLVLHTSCFEEWGNIAQQFLTPAEQKRIHICAGGKERVGSVHNGLQLLASIWGDNAHQGVVGIHDAVRPFVKPQVLEEAYQTAWEKGAAVPCVPVKSSLRQINPDTQYTQAVDRALFLEVQTPQTFRFENLLHAYEHRPNDAFTDDAGLYELMTQKPVTCTRGDYNNIKITTPEDMFMGERIVLDEGS